jgi:hypothetical protein
MVGAHRRVFLVLFFLSAVIYIHAQQPLQMASLRPGKELVWQRTSPSAGKPDGPVLYQILFRSSAHIGSIPKIGPTYTLVDSGLLLDNGGNLVIGGLTINGATGVVTFPAQQSSGNSTQDFWSLGGNTGTTPGTNRLGTNDSQPFELWVNGQRGYRIEPGTSLYGYSPNLVGGFSSNNVTAGAGGATIAGGGSSSFANRVTDDFGTVGGGFANRAGNAAGTTQDAIAATVAGGNQNTAGAYGTFVGGGEHNTASGFASTVAGGQANTAGGSLSTVAGGRNNTANGFASTVAGGTDNTASGDRSFAAGYFASADQDGCFVWGDLSTSTPTTCGAVNRFVVRATGGAQFSNGVNVDTSGADGGAFSNAANLLVFGGVSGEAIGSQRASGPGTNQYGLDFYTNGFDRMFIDLGGTVHVAGNLTKGGGSFQIDHPLDPANKYLSHSFVESPDMMNIYNGNAVLDSRGHAWVSLPDWFEALNMDFRYQLTPIGNPGQHILYIAQEIAHNRFKIAGGKPGARVSWQVTGVRHDAYANAHRIQVEEDKGDKRGTYLHPELIKTSGVVAGGRP